MSDAAAEFWRFSLALYARPGVAPACLVLQDQFGRDVNVALYGLWLGASGRGALSAATLADIDRKAAPWREQVVEKLRAARRAIKAQDAGESAALYAKAKAVELEAERMLQHRLAAQAPAADSSLPASQRLETALANLRLYIGTAPADPIASALRDFAAENFGLTP